MITSKKNSVHNINILTLFRGSNKKKESLIWRLFLLGSLWVPLKIDINSSLGSPNVMRPNAVPTTKNLKPLHVAWEKIRMYLYIRRLYAYNKSIGSITKQFHDSCLWIYVCQFSVCKHNMINYDQLCGLYTTWKRMNISEEVPEIWKTLSNHMLCCLRCTLIIKLFRKKNRVVAFFSSWTFYWTFELWSGSIPPFHLWKLDEHWSNLDKVS